MKCWSAVAVLIVAILQLQHGPVKGARILGVFPCPSKSHLLVFTTLTRELARRGHELVVVSPFPLDKPPANYTDIDLFPSMREMHEEMMGSLLFEMGDMWSFEIAIMFWYEGIMYTEFTFNHPQVRDLLKDDRGFDLVIVEDFMTDALYGFADYFKAPLVLISSLGGLHTLNYAMGNPSELAYVSNSMLTFTDHMTFLERFENVMLTVFWDLGIRWIYMPRQETLRKEFFGTSISSVWDLRYSASLALLNSHFSINYPRPLVPAVQEVGGIQVQRSTRPLPSDLQTFLDGAKKGAIYFSLGSNVRIDAMPPEKLNAVLAAFAALPQRVLFKWESDSVPVQSENIKFSKWFPQQDILAHPNLRVFFTHGGILSIQEATYHGIPLVGLPLFGDQTLNLRKAERDGYAVMLTLNNLTKSSVLWAVNKVLHDKSMYLEAQRRSTVFRDQLETPLERAVFWVEYVLRHKGAPHLRSAALDLAWYQLYLLDVAVVIFLFIFGIVFLFRLGWRRFCRKSTVTSRNKKNK